MVKSLYRLRQPLFLLVILSLASCTTSEPQAIPLPTRIPIWPTSTPRPTVVPPPTAADSAAIGPGSNQGFGLGAGSDDNVAIGSEQVDLYAVEAPEFPTDVAWLNTDQPLSLAQLRGKIVLLDFWTYGCINCVHNFPFLKRLEAQYPDELVVIGIHSAKFASEGRTENIRQVLERYQLTHPVINDADRRIWYAWNVRAWPTLVLLDPNGTIAGIHVGEGFYGPFNSLIRQLIDAFEKRGKLDRSPLSVARSATIQPRTVLSFPGKVLADPNGGRLFIADTGHHRIVMADADSGEVLGLIGSGRAALIDGVGTQAAFNWPQGMALSADGNTLYVADTGNHALRTVDLATGGVETLAGTGAQSVAYPPRPGTAPDVALASPWDLALSGDDLYMAMTGSHQIWRLHLPSGRLEPIAGSGTEGVVDGPGSRAALAQPSGLALAGDGWLYFVDSESSSVRRLFLTGDHRVETVAGPTWDLFTFGTEDGIGNQARFQHPLGIGAGADGLLYVADTYNDRIRTVDRDSRQTGTLAGSTAGWRDGADPLLYEPGGISLTGGQLYVADTNNHSVRVVDLATGVARTLVLKNIQRFTPDPGSSAYAGRVLQLAPVQVGPGAGTIALRVELPDGYKLNELAPFSLRWQSDNTAVVLGPDAEQSFVNPPFPVLTSAQFSPGQAQLTGDLAVVYCQAVTQDICLFDEVRLELPLVVEDGPDSVNVTYRVSVPD